MFPQENIQEVRTDNYSSLHVSTPTHKRLTVAALIHSIKLPLVEQNQYISASIQHLSHTPRLDNVLLLSDEVGGRRR